MDKWFHSLHSRLSPLAESARLHMRLENDLLFPAIAAIEHDLLAALER